jgi:molybdopterin-binding protein
VRFIKGPVSKEVVITIAGGNEIVSSITSQSAEHLKLRGGLEVYAIVKVSEVWWGLIKLLFFLKNILIKTLLWEITFFYR